MSSPRFRALSGPLVVAFVFVFFLSGLRTSVARADGGPPPDVVRTQDGGMVRGTILEITPAGDVTLLDAAGQTRKFPAGAVRFAGPVPKDPALAPSQAPPSQAPVVPGPPAAAPIAPIAPAAPVTPASAAAPPPGLHLLATEPNLTYHVLSGTSYGTGMGFVGTRPVAVGMTANHYVRLCTAPCTANLPPGSYTFAASRPDGGVVPASAMTIKGNETLTATYKSGTSARVGVLLVSVAAIGVGMLIAASGKQHNCTDLAAGFTNSSGQPVGPVLDCTDDYPNFTLGTTIAGIGILGLVVPLLIGDSVKIVPSATNAAP
ncbi:MAG TPA: hypothetical protein VHJ20_06505 [Polyangia bacterium]|nr:hypothetical protein [Polyangia bacterium]